MFKFNRSEELLATVEKQKDQLARYENRLRGKLRYPGYGRLVVCGCRVWYCIICQVAVDKKIAKLLFGFVVRLLSYMLFCIQHN